MAQQGMLMSAEGQTWDSCRTLFCTELTETPSPADTLSQQASQHGPQDRGKTVRDTEVSLVLADFMQRHNVGCEGRVRVGFRHRESAYSTYRSQWSCYRQLHARTQSPLAAHVMPTIEPPPRPANARATINLCGYLVSCHLDSGTATSEDTHHLMFLAAPQKALNTSMMMILAYSIGLRPMISVTRPLIGVMMVCARR